jgi:hypothetical protein
MTDAEGLFQQVCPDCLVRFLDFTKFRHWYEQSEITDKSKTSEAALAFFANFAVKIRYLLNRKRRQRLKKSAKSEKIRVIRVPIPGRKIDSKV